MAGLYVHVPFCRQKCVYCDFCSYPNCLDAARKYFSCLKKELTLYLAKEKKPFEIDTVFFRRRYAVGGRFVSDNGFSRICGKSLRFERESGNYG